MILNFLLIFTLIFLFILIVILHNINSKIENTKIEKHNYKSIKNFALLIGVIFLVFSLFAPYFFTNTIIGTTIISSTETGVLGDTVSGLMNPFIAIAGAVLTFLAFYIQYQANEEVKNQFEIQKTDSDLQKFESQFYEMLRIHRENVNDWIYISSNSKSKYSINGRIISVEIFKQYIKLKEEIEWFSTKIKISANEYLTENYKDKLKKLFPHYDLDELVILELSYIILFYGLSSTALVNIYVEKEKFNKNLERLILYLIQKPAKYFPTHWDKWDKGKSRIKFNQNDDTYIKYYGGHEHRLGHYFRHLYSLIRLVDNQTQLSYLKKWEYIGIIRSQLSNKEQFLLFVNSISYLGRGWEYEPFTVDKIYTKDLEQRKFITKYDLIRHIPAGIRDEFKARILYPNVEYERDESLTLERERLEKEVYK